MGQVLLSTLLEKVRGGMTDKVKKIPYFHWPHILPLIIHSPQPTFCLPDFCPT